MCGKDYIQTLTDQHMYRPGVTRHAALSPANRLEVGDNAVSRIAAPIGRPEALGTERHKPVPASPANAQRDGRRTLDSGTLLSMQGLAGNNAVSTWLSRSKSQGPCDAEEVSPVLDVVGKGRGRPLEENVRSGMAKAFRTDLSDVRIHDDQQASASAKSVNALAYTVGNDVVFQSGLYRPDSADGQRMLAHELTHVVQQREGPVDGTRTGDGVCISDPSDRFERAAEDNAERVTLEHDLLAQRDIADQIEPRIVEDRLSGGQQLQGLFVQRASGFFLQRDDDPSMTGDPSSAAGVDQGVAGQSMTPDFFSGIFDIDILAEELANLGCSDLGAADLAPGSPQSTGNGDSAPTAQTIRVQAISIQRDDPPTAGGDPNVPQQTRQASVADAANAVWQFAQPQLKQGLSELKYMALKDWNELVNNPTELWVSLSVSFTITAGVAGVVESNPDARKVVNSLIFGKAIPLPVPDSLGNTKLPGLSFQILGSGSQATGLSVTLDMGEVIGWK